MRQSELMKMAFTAIAGIGDIYTDAPECRAAVSAAENLAFLAGKFTCIGTVVTSGRLTADGQDVCAVDVCIDGSLIVSVPDGFDTSERSWRVVLNAGPRLNVHFYTGECADDESWVIADASAFYDAIFGFVTP
jgi:hypothetical protein